MDSGSADEDVDDGGLIKLAGEEPVDQIDSRWQSIAGEPVQFVASNLEGSINQKRSDHVKNTLGREI